ncbi:MAG: hypothetical protein HC767_06795 [Akkermansiaceae bacterium]|nr:hypothetical protein [Akkermansiaceae bacterium]
MFNRVICACLQDVIKSKAVSGGNAGKGAKEAVDKSKTKGKGAKKGTKKKGKRQKGIQAQLAPTGPVEVNICDFDVADMSGKYHLRLGVPDAALVFP